MTKTQSGFTLIEIMLAVVSIGIFIAIALPVYQDYTKRSHVAKSLTMTSNIRTAAVTHYLTKGVWPADNPDAGLASSTNVTSEAMKKAYTRNGVITIVFNERVQNNKQLQLSAVASSSSIEWVCRPSSNPQFGVDEKYLPARCRS